MNTSELKKALEQDNNEKYNTILNNIIQSNKIYFLDNKGELVLYKDDEGKSFVPIWSDKHVALLNPPKKK